MKHVSRLTVLCALVLSASSATAQTEEATVEVKQVQQLNGQAVRVQLSTRYEYAGRGHYMMELSLAIGDAPFELFERRLTTTRPSLQKTSSVEGVSFTVSYGGGSSDDLCPGKRNKGKVDLWGIDAKTQRPHLVSTKLVDDGVPTVRAAHLAALERGDDVLPALSQCSGHTDAQMVAMLRAFERGVKKLHDSGDASGAAKRVKRLFHDTVNKSGFMALASQGPPKEKALEYEQVGFLTSDGAFRICRIDYYDFTTTVDGCTAGWVDTDAKHAWLATNLGFYLTEGGEHELAVQVLRAASQAYPDHTPVWLNLGDSHRSLGQRTAAIAAYQQYVSQREARGEAIPQRVRVFLTD